MSPPNIFVLHVLTAEGHENFSKNCLHLQPSKLDRTLVEVDYVR